ncbi:MAG TPA: PfkB family carbohydrate kinase, partial [Solirubrobacteraceae bacterium]|nr:PfkB family carbohydrate kinase [Solirubrobacteraceae bacterium]
MSAEVPRSAKVGVVGHVEWVEFVRVDALPRAGEVVHAHETWEEAAGGGAVAAGQLAKLAGEALLVTALGADARGQAAREQLGGRARLRLSVCTRPGPQRRAITYVDAEGERTITVIGERLVPHGRDPLAWSQLASMDAVYFTGGDAEALHRAREARVLVCTPRALDVLVEGRVPIDVLVGSRLDPDEHYEPGMLDPPPAVVVGTEGQAGGAWSAADGRRGRWTAAPLPGPRVDAYGCGDSFAAGLTFGLGTGLDLEPALALAAR